MAGSVSASTIIGGASLALAAGSTAMTIAAQSRAAGQSAEQANYQAQVARNNQMIMERNAKLAEEQGQVRVDLQQQKTAQMIGSARAALAAQGGDVNSGSALDVQSDITRAGDYDAKALKYNAALEAWGYKNQAAGLGASAANYDRAAANATANLPYSIGSTLLGGATSISSRAYDMFKKK